MPQANPAGQALQTARPETSEKVPLGHGCGATKPAAEQYAPALQGAHSAAAARPEALEKVDTGHGHAVDAVVLAGQKWPGGQAVGATAPAGQYERGGQGLQATSPGTSA